MPESSFLSLTRRRFLTGTAGLGVGLAAFPGAVWAQGASGGVLNYATLGLDTSDPHRHTGSIAVQQAYVEALTSMADDGTAQPYLAEAFAVSPDGLTCTLTIRQGVTFHNGDTMTAEDVAANITRVKTKVKGGWLASAMALVDKVEVTDAKTVTLTMTEPYAPLLNLMSELWVLSPKSPGWDDTITQPIGTGPFTFGEWQPKVSLDAPAFRSYWQKGLPLVDAVRFDLRDGVDKTLALRAGNLDIVNVDRQSADQLLQNGAAAVKPITNSGWYFVAFNNRRPRAPFDDVRVRQAIAHSIDKAALMNFIGGANGIVGNQMAAPGNVYYDAALGEADDFAKPDLDKARALLAEAGVKPEEHTITCVSWQESYVQIVVEMVRKLGFKIDHVALDDLGAQKRLGQYDWDIGVTSSGPRADIFLRYVRLMSDGPNPVLWGGIQDPTLDEMIKAAVREPDLTARKAKYLEAMKRIIDKGYFYVIGHAPDLIAIREGVTGYEPGFTWACHWATGGVDHASVPTA